MAKANGVDGNSAAVAALLAGLLAQGTLTGKKAGQLVRSGKKAKGKGRVKLTDEEKTVAAKANEQEAIAECNKRGFANPVPRVNILTAKAWIEKGFVPKKGEKAIRVGKGIPLFHEAQVGPLVPASEQTH